MRRFALGNAFRLSRNSAATVGADAKSTWNDLADELDVIRVGEEEYEDAHGQTRKRKLPKHIVEERVYQFVLRAFQERSGFFFDAYPYVYLPDEETEKYGCWRGEHTYVNDGRGGMFKIGTKQISNVPNGTDGVLMLAPDIQPWPELTDENTHKYLIVFPAECTSPASFGRRPGYSAGLACPEDGAWSLVPVPQGIHDLRPDRRNAPPNLP